MTHLIDRIRRDIKNGGPMRMDEYMSLCLYHPDYGYYQSGDPIGKQGDFITAPEVSQMFGELILAWAMDGWAKMGQPDAFNLIELGPGHGTLLADGLRQAARYNNFMDAMDLHLVESNSTLRDIQNDALCPYSPSWHDTISDIPAGPSIIIANEFLDCLPIRQFIKTEAGNDDGSGDGSGAPWAERHVALNDENNLCFADRPLPDDLASRIIPDVHPGGVFEYCPGYQTIIQQLTKLTKTHENNGDKHPAIALFIDYGYTGTLDGLTLQAVKDHDMAAPFTTPGMTDLTAHVDFSHWTNIARQEGWTTHPIIPQGKFLTRLGIHARADQLIASNTPDQAGLIKKSLHRLTAVGEMGDLFKCSALSIHNNGSVAPWI